MSRLELNESQVKHVEDAFRSAASLGSKEAAFIFLRGWFQSWIGQEKVLAGFPKSACELPEKKKDITK